MIRALLKVKKIRAKNAVLDPVYLRKIDLGREEMFRCLSSLLQTTTVETQLPSYRAFSHDVMAAMLVYSKQKNFGIFFCLGHQHGRYAYCLLCLLGVCENALLFLIIKLTLTLQIHVDVIPMAKNPYSDVILPNIRHLASCNLSHVPTSVFIPGESSRRPLRM